MFSDIVLADDIFEPATFGVEDVAKNEKKILQSIRRRSRNLNKVFKQVDDIVDNMERRQTARKLAFIESYKAIQRRIPSIMRQIALEACAESIEYNFPPYLDRLTFAIQEHIDDILHIKPDTASKTIIVETNFDILGTPDEWFNAVDAVKQEHGWGKIPDPLVRSDIWAEKIYRPDREGGDVQRQKGDTEEYYDVTDNYIGRYTYTIMARLDKIPMDKAPFWYFMEYGNVGMREGEPYPEIAESMPTRFAGKTRVFIERLLEYSYDLFKSQADAYLAQLLANEFSTAIGEANIATQNLKNTIDYMEEKTSSILENLQAYKDEINIRNEKILQEINDIDKDYISYFRSGKLVTRARRLR